MSITIDATLVASFRESSQGRAFSDDTVWPDDVVKDALCEADAETGSGRWGIFQDVCSNFKRRGMFYFAAHWLASTYLTQDASDPTNISPSARLNIASKSVGDESVTYRVTGIEKTQNDWLSLTNYGVQYMRLRDRAGKGAVVV